ncbi:MAG TPA: hypothetical protein VGI59_04610 [Candidatus Udaeobacter sp.]|jgi:hypothetical protein
MEDFIRQFTRSGSAGHPGASGFFLVRTIAPIHLERYVVEKRPAGERF